MQNLTSDPKKPYTEWFDRLSCYLLIFLATQSSRVVLGNTSHNFNITIILVPHVKPLTSLELKLLGTRRQLKLTFMFFTPFKYSPGYTILSFELQSMVTNKFFKFCMRQSCFVSCLAVPVSV